MPTRRTTLASLILFVALSTGFEPPTALTPWGPWTATAHAGSAIIGGRRMSCRYGKVVFNNKLPDLGMAARGTIWLNRRLLRKFSPAFQQFVFLHECAHQYVWNEADADCWAIQRGVYRRIFTRQSIKQICRVMKGWKGGLWHNTGPSRCGQIRQCFVKAKQPTAASRRSKRRRSARP